MDGRREDDERSRRSDDPADRTEDLGSAPIEPSWAVVDTFPSRAAAGFAAAALGDVGVRTRIDADDGGGTLPHLDPLTGGVRLLVPGEDLPLAQQALGDLAAAQATADVERPSDVAAPGRLRLAFALVLVLALAVTIGSVFLTNGVVLR